MSRLSELPCARSSGVGRALLVVVVVRELRRTRRSCRAILPAMKRLPVWTMRLPSLGKFARGSKFGSGESGVACLDVVHDRHHGERQRPRADGVARELEQPPVGREIGKLSARVAGDAVLAGLPVECRNRVGLQGCRQDRNRRRNSDSPNHRCLRVVEPLIARRRAHPADEDQTIAGFSPAPSRYPKGCPRCSRSRSRAGSCPGSRPPWPAAPRSTGGAWSRRDGSRGTSRRRCWRGARRT